MYASNYVHAHSHEYSHMQQAAVTPTVVSLISSIAGTDRMGLLIR
jgi:hypothetical protein